MAEELKNCPFCGAHAQDDFIPGESYIIECYACDARTGNCDGEDAAVAAWNRRATPPSPSTVASAALRDIASNGGSPGATARAALQVIASLGPASKSAPSTAEDERAASDLSERLRRRHQMEIWDWDSLIDAANMIDKLRAALSANAADREAKRLRKVLEEIASVNAMDYEYQRWARNALAGLETDKEKN